MKKLFIFLFFIPSLLMAQPIDTNTFKYYPLKIGNSWTYRFFNVFMGTFRYKLAATSIVTLNGKFYFEMINYRTGYSPSVS